MLKVAYIKKPEPDKVKQMWALIERNHQRKLAKQKSKTKQS